MDDVIKYLVYWIGYLGVLVFMTLIVLFFVELGQKYYADYKFSQHNSKVAKEGDDHWNNSNQHRAFHKYWLWLEHTNLELSADTTSIILTRLVYFLDKNNRSDLALKLASNASTLNLKVSLSPKLRSALEYNQIKQTEFVSKLKGQVSADLSQYLIHKGKSAPDYLIDIGSKYWMAGHKQISDELIDWGIQGLVNYPKEWLHRNVEYMESIKSLMDMDKCDEATYLFERIVSNEYIKNRFKKRVENCSRKKEVLLSLVLSMELYPTQAVNFEAFGYDNFSEAAEALLRYNLDHEANILAIHEDKCNQKCGPTRQTQLARLYKSLNKSNPTTLMVAKKQNAGMDKNAIITLNDSTSEILAKMKNGFINSNLNELLRIKLDKVLRIYSLDRDDYKSTNKMDDILEIYLLVKDYNRALWLSSKFRRTFDREESLTKIVRALSTQKEFGKARKVLDSFSKTYSCYGESMSYLAVELYRSGQVDEAIKLISKIPNTHLNQEKSFEGICNINIALKKYKLAIYFAFKASQVDYKSKIEAALFTIMPKCNSSEQLEILAYVIRQLENREEDYWNNLAKLKMIVGKYYISLKHTKTGLDLIEKGLLEYPAIEEIVGIDLYLKSYNLDLINQAKIIKVALHHKEELYVFRRRRSIQKKTKPTSLRDGIFFHNSCELCKKDPIGFTKIKFQH